MIEPADPIRIEPVTGRVGEAAALLATALAETPISRARLPDPKTRPWILRGFLAVVIRVALRRGLALAAVDPTDRTLLGVVLAMPPGQRVAGPGGRARLAGALVRAALVAPGALPRYLRSVRASRTAALVPADGWYFHALGVLPAARGRGVGRRLLAAALHRVDASGRPAYTHAAHEAIAGLLASLGFEAEPPIPDSTLPGVRYLPMSRPATDRSRG